MAEKKDKVLVIDHDADERAVLVEAALEPFGYAVRAAADAPSGLAVVQADRPDVIVLDLHLEGLSGRDVMAALSAQALDVPVILLADEGAEREALQLFRLGAKDYVVRPIREAELVQAIERALKEVRLRRDREALIREVQQAAEEAQRHLRELRTLMGIGKSITALHTLNDVLDRVVRAAVQLTGAGSAGFFLRDEQTGALILRAGQNLSRDLARRIGQPVDDDLAALVMSSRETYIASSEGLQRFHPAQEGVTAVIYAPLVVHDAAIGLLWVANERVPFEEHMKDLMTALADYAAIAVVNARLFATMQERTRQLEQLARQPHPEAGASQAETDARCRDLALRVRQPLTTVLGTVNMFRAGEMGRLASSHQAAVDVMHRQLEELIRLVDSLVPPDRGGL